ncbi:MAG: hypothetical protein GC191_08330 [Azospirillum sp.]|nr:hypothetical protein [Azospirillum sp.]
MARNAKKQSATQANPVQATLPWTCTHLDGQSEIEARNAATGVWETIASVKGDEGFDRRAAADLIVKAVNAHESHRELIAEMAAALELCLACNGLSWEAEQEAAPLVERAKRLA